MSELSLKWERCTSDRFPHDTNLYAVFPGGHTRLIGWVRQCVGPEFAGFHACAPATIEWYFSMFSLERYHPYSTRALAMRALRTAAIATWIGTPYERREHFINAKGRI